MLQGDIGFIVDTYREKLIDNRFIIIGTMQDQAYRNKTLLQLPENTVYSPEGVSVFDLEYL
jgi:hypothetical protein